MTYYITQTDGQWIGVHDGRPEPLYPDGLYLRIIAKYPNMQLLNTGGGCMAIHHVLDESRGTYLLITDADGDGLPDDDAPQVLCGRYDERGSIDANEEGAYVRTDELTDWLDHVLGLT